MYARVLGQSARIDKLVQRLQRIVRNEVAAQTALTHTLGVLDALFAAQSAL